MYENEKGRSGSEPQLPTLADFGERLRCTTNSIGDLTFEIEAKLQTILRINGQVEAKAKDGMALKEQPIECAMDELNMMLNRLNDYKNRISGCLGHLHQII